MPSGSRVLLGLLVFSLSLIGPSLSQCQSLSPNESLDGEAVRRLTGEYALAMAAGEPDKIKDYWNPQSTNLKARLKYYQNLVSEARLEILSSRVTRIEVTNDKAVSQLTTDERRLDKKTGAQLLTYSLLRGVCRTYQWTKIDGAWKIERELLVQDELAAKLEAAASERERDELLEKEKVFVTNALILALSGRGFRYSAKGDHEAGLRCFQLQLAVAEKVSDQVGIAGAWLNIGHMKYQLDDYEVALEYARKALAIYESLGLRRGVALALERFSHIYRALGDHRRALNAAQRSLRLSEEEKNRRGTVQALSELANIYGSQNNSEQALAHTERALTIASELGDRILTATLRHDAAADYLQLGNYKRALEIYQQLLKQTEGFGDRGGAAMVRDQIGKVFAAQGEYAEALNYFKQSLAGVEAANMKQHATAVVLNDISRVYLAQKRYEEALPTAERSIVLSRQSRRQLDIWWALTLLGQCQLGLNRITEARQSFSEAVSIGERLRLQAAGGIEERQRYFEGRLRAHHGLLEVLVKENKADEALVIGERAKARGLLDMLLHGEINVQKAMTAEEREQEKRLKFELTQLNKRLLQMTQSDGRQTEIEAQLEKARLKYEAFQNSLYAAHPELKVQRGEAPSINASELASLVPTDTTVLEYVVTDDHTYLFAITKSRAAGTDVQVFTLPIKQEELATQTEAFRLQLARRDLGFRSSAAKLYELLLKPAETQLRGKSKLVIVPDQTLWDLPFQALLTGANRYVIEQSSISYAPSLTVLREMTKRRENRSDSLTLLALGNPGRKPVTITRASFVTRDNRADPLPEAEQEVKILRQLYGPTNSKVYVGSEAREDVVKSEASRARILHFATHGMLNNASPMYSSLELVPGGANEDGLLEAWELMQLDLNAELAVLSACETARGRIGPGEGIIGMSWAMFIAGVPSVVVSQWKVEAAGTRDLMVNFHRDLIGGRGTKSEALRQASLKLMKNPETSHPFYWAGFVLVGDDK
jgi:CHAT domain-containing protein